MSQSEGQGPRLEQHDNGKWYIRIPGRGGRRLSTRTRNRDEAQAALARYVAEQGRPDGPRDPSQLTVAACLDLYGTERAPHVRDPERIADCIQALVPVLGPLPVGAITGEVCRRYAKARQRAPGTVRKELGTLAAAINHCHAEGYLTAAPKIRLPAKPAPRDRWLARDEVAKLIRAARRNPKARHLCKFILVAAYTGTRKEAILGLRFMPHTRGGHVDTEAGLMYRRASGKAETKKRQPPIPVPPRLLAHMRRWKRAGARHVVEVQGASVANVKTAWRTALAASGIAHATPHDLRRTAITWAMQAGMDRWQASGFFGVTLDVIESTYGHHHPDYLRGAAELMGRRTA